MNSSLNRCLHSCEEAIAQSARCQYWNSHPVGPWLLKIFNTLCSVSFEDIMSRLMTKPIKWHVRPAKTQIGLGICPVWSESWLWAQWVAKDPSFLHATAKTLIRLGRCPGWSESSLGAHAILLVLSQGGSYWLWNHPICWLFVPLIPTSSFLVMSSRSCYKHSILRLRNAHNRLNHNVAGL